MFFSGCEKGLSESKGEFNEIVIVSSLEDKKILEPIIDEYIFESVIHTPEPEFIYTKRWISPSGFKYYKEYSNIIIVSIIDPIDESIDYLMETFESIHDISEYPVTIQNIYASPQIITLVKANSNQDLEINLNYTVDKIKNFINTHIDLLYFSRYQNSKNLSDSLNISSLSSKLFDIDLLVDSDFKIIDSSYVDNKYLWIGKGAVEVDNSASYQWLFIKKIDSLKIIGNLDFEKIVRYTLEDVQPNIDLVSNFNKYSKLLDNKNKCIYKMHSVYNHNLYKTGGPMIVYLIEDKIKNESIIFYGLVNAPGKSKIKHIKELETIIINSNF